MCLVKCLCGGSFSYTGGDMEIVNEAEFYTLHPFAVQSEVRIEDREKQVSYLVLECLLSLTSEFFAFQLLSVITNIKMYRNI